MPRLLHSQHEIAVIIIIIIIVVAAAFLNEMNGVFQFNWCLNLIDVAFIFN